MGKALIRREKVVLVGFGAIGSTVIRLLGERGGLGQVAAIGLRATSKPPSGLPAGVPVLTDPDQLAGIDAGLVVEVAGRAAVAPWGQATSGQRAGDRRR